MDDRLQFVWEKFMGEPRGKSKAEAWYQVLAFNIDIAFEEGLMDSGFSIEEATAVYTVDTDLRSIEGINPKTKEVTINIE